MNEHVSGDQRTPATVLDATVLDVGKAPSHSTRWPGHAAMARILVIGHRLSRTLDDQGLWENGRHMSAISRAI